MCSSTYFFLGWNIGMTDRAPAATLDHKVDNTRWGWRSSKSRGIWTSWLFETPLYVYLGLLLWDREIWLSCLKLLCFGFFFFHSQSKLILTKHSENSFLKGSARMGLLKNSCSADYRAVWFYSIPSLVFLQPSL